ncbi:tetratricopeptide repeat protein [Actinoplanes sp. NPDC051861]|uniref:tetratricopeptide repeat protein n=1 Tax=Actinoplanes sp. NPDC051861 TaxID=3155170 RepID=UPI00343144A2
MAAPPDPVSLPHAAGVQAGSNNTQHNYFGQRRAVTWPLRVGVVPRRAHGRQTRPADQSLADVGAGQTTVVCQVVAGLGGVGKTQLAANLAERLWAEQAVDLLVWVTATSRTSILSTYALAAGEISGVDDPDPQAAATRLLSWLAGTGRRWLIVLDDLTSPADLTGLWPPETPAGRTVVTTRRRDAALLAGRGLVDVGVFTPGQALTYLTRLLGDDPARLASADQLAADLGHLPLALAQAAAYMLDQDLSCGAYRERLARHSLARLHPETLPDQQSQPVGRAWTLSIEAADAATGGLATVILQVAAFLDPNGIPTQLFTTEAAMRHYAAGLGTEVDADDVQDAIRALHRLSLIEMTGPAGEATTAVRIHALVQRVTRESTPEPNRHPVTLAAADAMTQIWPPVEPDAATSRLGQQLRANTAMLANNSDPLLWRAADGSGSAHAVLYSAGNSLGEIGLVAAARAHYQQMYATATTLFGHGHKDILAIRAHQANWQGEAGDAAGAAAAFERLLADDLRTHGPDHPNTLSTRHSLAEWQGHAGNAAEAADALEVLVADEVRIHGPDHPRTLTTRQNLARWRVEADGPAGALAELEQLVLDCARVNGPDHPHTLTARANLAFCRGEAGDATGAADAFEELLADRVRILGPDHPDTLTNRGNAASWRGQAGDPAGAAAELEAVLPDFLRILGPEHPHTLTTRHILAQCRGRAGDPAGAAAAFEQLLADKLRIFGPAHPDINGIQTEINLWRRRADAR